jgi:arginine decarboxylase
MPSRPYYEISTCNFHSVHHEESPVFPTPTRVFLTNGIGIHRHTLTAFELALRDADIEQQNLVYVSSILPPGCELITREAGVAALKPGDITFCVMARIETNEPGRHIHASIGLALPADPETYGYISEYHGFGQLAEQSGDHAEDLAASMLASTLGWTWTPRSPGTNASVSTNTAIWSLTVCR